MRSLSVQAGLALAVGGGLANLKCLYPSGDVRNYIGVRIHAGPGIGVRVFLNEVDTRDLVITNAILAFGEDFDEADLHIVTGMTSSNFFSSWAASESVSQNFGLGLFGNSTALNIELRFFNGKKRWGYVLDQINKSCL